MKIQKMKSPGMFFGFSIFSSFKFDFFEKKQLNFDVFGEEVGISRKNTSAMGTVGRLDFSGRAFTLNL